MYNLRRLICSQYIFYNIHMIYSNLKWIIEYIFKVFKFPESIHLKACKRLDFAKFVHFVYFEYFLK